MNELPPPLQKWSEYNQFILCKLVPLGNGKSDKIPVDINGHHINPHDPANWLSHDYAIMAAQTLGLHVGFVFTANDPFWFIDIDHCIVDGQQTPIAKQLTETFQGAAVELSASGTGLHIFGCAKVPEHAKKNKQYGIEFYSEGRFVLLTGVGATGEVWLGWNDHIRWLVETYFPNRVVEGGIEWRNEPVPEWSGPEDDDQLIDKIKNSHGSIASRIGGKVNAYELFTNDIEAIARTFPPLNNKDPYDRSSADAALANHLAFWTGKNHERIKRLMYRSALVRDKWEKHKTYLIDTITHAVNGCNNVYGGQQHVEAEILKPSTSLEPQVTVGVQFMSASQQIEYFKDCVYIKRAHGILTPQGVILKPEAFKAMYAGYTFALDSQNTKTTKNAWEAFIDNQAVRFPRVDGTCFRPRLPAKVIIEEEGFLLINTYVPINIKRVKGDVTPFINHMRKLFPVEKDYQIIMAFIASLVQNPGVKFQWCPLIQGGEGNGKSLISRVIERAVGTRYTHYPNASELGNGGLKFNGWVEGNVYIAIEEIFVNDRRELTEPLKILITNDRMEIQYKGQDQYTGDNLANIVMMTNHKDAMKIKYDQRRYWVSYTPQQTEADLKRDGMDGTYFKDLYDWCNHDNGYAKVAEYLHTYEIPDQLNPATYCQRAPKSSSTDEVVKTSLGFVEQCVLEAIEEERQGFRGGYVSSKCLNDLLKEIKYDNRMSPVKRKEMLEGLGYRKHPWLRNGRVDNPVAAEGAKITLYCNHELDRRQQVSASAVKEHYEQIQGYVMSQGLQIVK